MEVVAVGVDPDEMEPVVVLCESSGQRRLLPIWIGLPEATAIELERQHSHPARPVTHQLLGAIVEAFGRRLEQVRITTLREGLFHAELVFDPDTRVSSRASDAIAVALHLQVPIHATDAVLDQAGLANAQVSTAEPAAAVSDIHKRADELEKFRRYLDTARPEDFDVE